MARAEVYAVRHDQRSHSRLKDKGLSSEEIRYLMLSCLERQIPSYLGEFILKSPFKEFFYEEEVNSQTGQKEIHAPGFIGPIADVYDNAIWENRRHGQSGRREIAECEGFRKLERALLETPEGTFYLWISPPGTKEEGYGDYSFTHLGQIKERGGNRRIEVTAVRNSLTLEEHAQILNHFLPEERQLKNPKDTDFLRNPILIENGGNQTIHDLLVAMDVVLKGEYSRTSQFAKDYRERKDWEKELLEMIKPMINDYYSLIEEGAIWDELQRIIWAIENYTASSDLYSTYYTRDMMNRKTAFMVNEGPVPAREWEGIIFYERLGFEPEKLGAGGCPPDPSSWSKDPFSPSAVLPSQQHTLENSQSPEGQKKLKCECPNCHQKVEAIIENGKIHCPACGVSAEYQC